MTNFKPVITLYVALGNKDQTEGRGGYEEKRTFLTAEDAVEWAESKDGHNALGVMGYGPAGEIVAKEYFKDSNQRNKALFVRESKVWGYRKDWQGKFSYGWMDNRDAPTKDPEYQNYLRLKTKFEVE